MKHIENIKIENKKYSIRHNYLHRYNSRLVLNHKVDGHFVFIQIDYSKHDQLKYDLEFNKYQDKEYEGLWCDENGHRDILFKIL